MPRRGAPVRKKNFGSLKEQLAGEQAYQFTRPALDPLPLPILDKVKGPTARLGYVVQSRTGRVAGVADAVLDAFGLPIVKYRHLGPRARANIARALADGMLNLRTSGTPEEMICYGELIRRGYTYGLGSSNRSFLWQSPVAGNIVDFEVWHGAERIALRPQNVYWHGHLVKQAADERKAEELVSQGYTVADIWSPDLADDATLALKFNQYFGQE